MVAAVAAGSPSTAEGSAGAARGRGRGSADGGEAPEEAATDQAMRLLKRMKPNELREISKAATALEKSKVEDSKKVSYACSVPDFVV